MTSDKYVRLEKELREIGCKITDQSADAIHDLRKALEECAAPFDSGPGTVWSTAQTTIAEFERRMQVASDALTSVKEVPHGA